MGLSDAPHPPAERLTITMPMINRSRSVWVIASGDAKADAVADSLDGYTALPAARARGTQQTLWFVDREAASKLHTYRCPA
ncbi:alcohol dehydrogenase [Platysternon megacephalum]|uniref:Alcohol dehydrogenase n=1 Tax=Platysternon megacephalum TaxID=55544 RepID=A0A4D9DGN1_9SAUR|nr:alcohol dehydrogenase [Platysternon megacephalum]